MDTIKKLLGTAAFDFGGIIVFYILLWLFGLRAAIAGTLLFVPIDAFRRHKLRIGFPRLYVISTTVVLVFGSIDVFSKQPFMLRYEGALTEFILACAFAWGSRGRSIIEELATQQQPDLDFPHMRRFFQLVTRTWAIYYVCMAGFYAWVGQHFSLVHAVAVRQATGIAGAMLLALFSFSGRFAFRVYQRLGLLPPPPRAMPGEAAGPGPAA